jgi:hypothetical protein
MSYTASGINNVSSLSLNTPSITLLEIQGSGSLGFSLLDLEGENLNNTIKPTEVLTVDTLNVSGCNNIIFPNTRITNINVTGSNITGLDIEQVVGLTNIYLIDNPRLNHVGWPNISVLNNLTVSDNPLLTGSVGWTTQNVSNMVFTGLLDDNLV